MRPLHRNGRNAVEDDGQTAFLPREEWAARPGEESWRRRRCSKGSSGEAIPCQPRPLKRRHWARVTLDREKWHFPDFQDRNAMRKVLSPGVLASRHRNRRYRQRPCANPGLIEISAIGPPLASSKPAANSRPRSDRANAQTNLTQEEGRRNCHSNTTPASYWPIWPCEPRRATAGRAFENGKARDGRGSIESGMQPRLSQRQAMTRRVAMRLAAWSPQQCRGLRDSPQWLRARQRRNRPQHVSGRT